MFFKKSVILVILFSVSVLHLNQCAPSEDKKLVKENPKGKLEFQFKVSVIDDLYLSTATVIIFLKYSFSANGYSYT